MKNVLTLTALIAGYTLTQASDIGYVFHFNVDENLPGSEELITSGNWNLAYGPSATDGVGDPNIASGLSEGGSSTDPVPLPRLRPNNRGFIFASGAGDLTTGFAPEALFFWRTDLTTTNVPQGGKTSGTVQMDWGVNVNPPEKALSSLTLGDLISITVWTRPRNIASTYYIAVRLGSDWYVDAAGRNNLTTGWEAYTLAIQSASLYPLPFDPGVTLDVDVTDNGSVTVASLDPATTVTGYGLYVDTDALQGSPNGGSWVRGDVYYIRAIGSPKVTDVAATSSSVDVIVDSASGVEYSLVRDTDLNGSYSTVVDGPVSGDDTDKTLSDPDTSTAGSDKVFYKVTGELE